MQTTTNYGFKKPEGSDIVDFEVFNYNSDLSDNHLNILYGRSIPYGGSTSGTANTYTISKPVITAADLKDGIALSFKINADSTGASTLNWCSTGAIPIKKANGNDMTNLKNGGIYTVRFNGTNFVLQGEGGSGTAKASDLLLGKTATTDAGDITGTMPNNGALGATLAINGTYTIPAGYTTGGTITQNVTTKGATNYSPSTIAQTIPGGTYLTGTITIAAITGTANTNQVLAGYTFNSSAGIGLTGGMTNNGAITNTIGSAGGTYTIPQGYHNGAGVVTAPSLAAVTSNTTVYSCEQIVSGWKAISHGVMYEGSATIESLGGRHVTTGSFYYTAMTVQYVECGFTPSLILVGTGSRVDIHNALYPSTCGSWTYTAQSQSVGHDYWYQDSISITGTGFNVGATVDPNGINSTQTLYYIAVQ